MHPGMRRVKGTALWIWKVATASSVQVVLSPGSEIPGWFFCSVILDVHTWKKKGWSKQTRKLVEICVRVLKRTRSSTLTCINFSVSTLNWCITLLHFMQNSSCLFKSYIHRSHWFASYDDHALYIWVWNPKSSNQDVIGAKHSSAKH